ncbi:MAG: MFS transporter [Chromatiales bacterium]|jgi:EmrB/QacA subfamily drug resistance transporter|nr:MFS transporter [Chromatiales bacterium]
MVDESKEPVATADFRHKLLAMIGLCFVLVMVALDQTVIGTALPTIVAELRGFELYAWVGTSYLLASIITVPIFGKLGDDYGRKSFLLAAIVVFTSASVLCGFSQNMVHLVLARGLQGVGGGMLIATTFASVPDLFPEARERLRWQVLFSMAFGLSNAAGPTLGGVITEFFGWRWVFFINLPVCVLGLWFVWRHLPRIRHSEGAPAPLDWAGSLLLAVVLASLLLLVEWLAQGKHLGAIAVLIAVGVTSGVALVWWERRRADPLLPLDMIGDRNLQVLFLLSAVVGFCLFGVVYYAPLLFQGGMGLSPKAAGLLVTPLAVFITIGSIVNGRIVMRIPTSNPMLYIGMAFFAVAALMLTRISPHTPHALIYAAMGCAGLGLGFMMPNLTLLAQASVARARLGVTTATLQSTRMIGGMLGMALIGVLISKTYGARVHDMLLVAGEPQWAHWMSDPRILVDEATSTEFIANAGQTGSAMLASARDALISAVHGGHWLIFFVALCALLVVRRLPPMSLQHRQREVAPHE